MSTYRILTAAEYPGFESLNDKLALEVWPTFMLNGPVANQYWPYLYEFWPQYQFVLLEGDEVVALGNSLPAHWTQEAAALPDQGWDWILPKAVEDHRAGRSPTVQFALQVMVPLKHRGKGWSQQALIAMADIGRAHDLKQLYAPIRPSGKSQYPLIPMEEYITWQNDRAQAFDPWLRVHLRLGAALVNICPFSMTISGTIAQWQEWAAMPFPGSGQHIVPGALCPVSVDAQRDEATYIEPNIWLAHPLS